jgi:hypothetical protein
MEGLQMRQADAERNMLRQAQMQQMAAQQENMAAQRAERLAMAADRDEQARARRAAAARQAEDDEYLSKVSALFEQNNTPLNLKTAQQGLAYAVKSRNPSAIQMMTKTVQALQEKEDYAAEATRLGLPGAAPAPAATPSIMRQPAAAAPAAPMNMLAGTPVDIGMGAPAPANALAAPPAAPEPMAGGFTRSQINAMAGSDVKAMRERGERLLKLLPKDQPPRLADKFVPVGKLVFDRETGQFITPPAAAIAATQDRGAPAPAPAPALKPLTAAQEVARRDKIGKEFKSASSALQTTQDVLDSIAAVKSAPGLSRATGFTGTLLPSFPEGEAAQAETRLANLKGKVTALGKAAAAASGAIGSIANQEWKILADQIAAIEPVKGTGPLLEQIGLVEAQAVGAMERIRDAYNRQFGEDFERFPQFRDLPPPKSTQPKGRKSGGAVTPAGAAPAARPNIDALLDKYE